MKLVSHLSDMFNKEQLNMTESPVSKFKKQANEQRRNSLYQSRVENFKQKVNMSDIIPFKIPKL
jgi:hypothetical protein